MPKSEEVSVLRVDDILLIYVVSSALAYASHACVAGKSWRQQFQIDVKITELTRSTPVRHAIANARWEC